MQTLQGKKWEEKKGNASIRSTSLATASLPVAAPAATMARRWLYATMALFLSQEAPNPCPCPEAVSGWFHTYHCPSGANKISDKHNKKSKSPDELLLHSLLNFELTEDLPLNFVLLKGNGLVHPWAW